MSRTYDKGKVLYICPISMGWDDLQNAAGPLRVADTNAAGFYLYYDSREAYDAEHPTIPPLEVHVLGQRGELYPESLEAS